MENLLNHGKARVIGGAALVLFFILLAMFLEGFHFHSILQLSELFIVSGGVVAAGVMGGRESTGGSSIKLLFLQGVGRRDKAFDPLDAAERLNSMGNGAICAGVLGTIFGLIHVMENLDKPNQIGPGIGVAFVCMVYSIMFWAWCKGLQQIHLTESRARGHQSTEKPDSLDITMAGFSGILLLLCSTFVVLYALSIAGKKS